MSLRAALRILGLPASSTKESALASWKRLTVLCRRNGNDEYCKILSQAKEVIKRHSRRRCVDCGVVLSYSGRYRCGMHYQLFRNYGKSLNP